MATAAARKASSAKKKRPKLTDFTDSKGKKVDWIAATTALATCVRFALSHRKHLSRGSGLLMRTDAKTGKRELKRWEDDFFDALEMVGIEYDRKAYFASPTGKRRD